MNRILTLPRIGFAVLLISGLIFGCKKLDTASNDETKTRKDFFTVPANAPSVIKRTIAEFERQNKITGFVKDLVAQNGMPLWDKSIINIRERKNVPTAGFDGDGSFEIGDTIVFTPLVEQDSLFVNGFFMSKLTTDSVELHLYRGNDYDNYAHGRLTSDSLTAERITIQLMSLNSAVFGYKEFITTDSVLFKDDAPIDPDSSYAFTAVKLKEDPGSGFAPSTTQNLLLTAVTVCRYSYSARTGRGNDNSENSFMPWGGGSQCTTTILVGYEWPPEYPIPTDGGEGGGMGSPPANGNCTGNANCRQGSIISQGRFPCGDCGPGPIIVVPPDDPPPYNPYVADTVIVDTSTAATYPCVTRILNSLGTYANANAVAQVALHNVFDINEKIKLTFKADSSLIALGDDGRTNYNTAQRVGDTYYATVMLNPLMLSRATEEYIASTIIHEAVHSYVNYQYDQYLLGLIDSTTFKNLFPLYWPKVNSSGTIIAGNPAQHQAMAANMIQIMAQPLRVLYPHPDIPAATRDSIYHALSWAGLDETYSWSIRSDTTYIRAVNRMASDTSVRAPWSLDSAPSVMYNFDSHNLNFIKGCR